jgi:hypothetical protein
MMRRPGAAALLMGLALALPRPARAEEKEAEAPVRLLEFAIEDAAVRRVIQGTTVSRAVEPTRFPGRAAHEEFLLDHLPLSAALGRRLSPSLEPYRVTERAPGVWGVEEGDSIRGQTRLVAAAAGRRVYITQGEFRSLAQLVRFEGAMVITLRFWEAEEAGQHFLRNEPHVYVRIENPFLRALAKLFSLIVQGIIERRVSRLAAAANAVSARLAQDPKGLYEEMGGWPEVSEKDREDYRHYFRLEGKSE